MKIEYVTGDLLQSPELFILQGCNAQGVMGSGVAKAIRDRYPEVFNQYRAEYDERGLRLGQTIWVNCDPHVVINAITQEFYGREEGRRYADYDAIETAIQEIDSLMVGLDSRVAMPLIGAGLAQGSWAVISDIIETNSKNFQPVVYLIDGVTMIVSSMAT